jgi:hypothetical protein
MWLRCVLGLRGATSKRYTGFAGSVTACRGCTSIWSGPHACELVKSLVSSVRAGSTRTQQSGASRIGGLEHSRSRKERTAFHAVLPEICKRGWAEQAAEEARWVASSASGASLQDMVIRALPRDMHAIDPA